MDDFNEDMNTSLMLDGNAVGGQLQEIFGHDMTMAVARCASCARDTEMGAMLAFTRAPGVVLRCPTCQNPIARIVETPAVIYLDMRGAQYVRLSVQS